MKNVGAGTREKFVIELVKLKRVSLEYQAKVK